MRSRAVHIEFLDSMNTDSCLNALRRFIAIRGKPKVVYSDNGRNFVGAARELKITFRSIAESSLADYASRQSFEWQWITPYSPWKGGVWERIVKILKSVLNCLLFGESRLTDDALRTFFAEAMCILNNRPLTKLTADPRDYGVITPAHLLHLASDSGFAPGDFTSADALRSRWRRVQFLVQQFWLQWLRLYLPELQKTSKWHASSPNIKEGSLVLVTDLSCPRNLWPLARVVGALPGTDGRVRSVTIKTQSGSVFDRPVAKLVLLEADI
jgi:hypothetical protein